MTPVATSQKSLLRRSNNSSFNATWRRNKPTRAPLGFKCLSNESVPSILPPRPCTCLRSAPELEWRDHLLEWRETLCDELLAVDRNPPATAPRWSVSRDSGCPS